MLRYSDFMYDLNCLGIRGVIGSILVNMSIFVDVITFNVKCPVKPWTVVTFNPSWPFRT